MTEDENQEKEKEKEENMEKMKAILKEHGIEMDIGGCGCCGSPLVGFKYKGEIIFDYDDCNFTMIEKKK